LPPSLVFALAFALLGWIVGHSVAYNVVGLLPPEHHSLTESAHHGHDHTHHDPRNFHGYMDSLGLVGGAGLVLAFAFALRAFFRHGTFGEWLREGGVAGNRRQAAMAAGLPAAVFVLVEHLERWVAGTGTLPSTRLLLAGILVELVVGLLCLALVRPAFRVAERVFDTGDREAFARRSRRVIGFLFATTVLARSSRPMADRAAGRAPPLFSGYR